jgi:UDPglucose--hexose-1-phosphate uridylyltransferase
MNLDQLKDTPHRRFNPLTQEWVIVSPHRTQRPWQGKVEKAPLEDAPQFDPNCYLCPGNARAGGSRNPKYSSTFTFDNDYAALLPEPLEVAIDHDNLLIAGTERGICRVGCFSPRHDLTIPRMSVRELRPVVDMWIDQFNDLGSRAWVKHVQIFENRGAMMGASNPHPHCQIWATAHLPNQTIREQTALTAYWSKHRSCMLCDYVRLESGLQQRVICENDCFTVLVPFWAVWPFETLLISKRHLESIADLDSHERDQLGEILQQITVRYDNLFEVSFPYSMGFHQRPTDGESHPEWHLHAHFYPPLLRSATIQKFMVGYEMLGGPQRDITPEAAADRLQNVSRIHFRDRAV